MCVMQIEFLSDYLRSQQKIDRIWKEAKMQMSRQVFLSCFSAVSVYIQVNKVAQIWTIFQLWSPKSNRDLNAMLHPKHVLNHLKTTSTQFAPIHVPTQSEFCGDVNLHASSLYWWQMGQKVIIYTFFPLSLYIFPLLSVSNNLFTMKLKIIQGKLNPVTAIYINQAAVYCGNRYTFSLTVH